MAHFAEIDENNVVQRVIVVSNKNTSDSAGVENEDIGVSYCRALYGSDTNWKQCSYTMKIRKVFPSPGMVYSSSLDVFHLPQPFSSWTLSSDAIWEPPVVKPSLTDEQREQGYYYSWNEDQYQNDPENGWILFTPQIITIDSQPSDVSVGVGSSVELTTTFSINKGNCMVVVQHNPDGEGNFWYSTDWTHERFSETSFTANNNSGIVTTTDATGKYRVVAIPTESGNPVGSNTITLTVTE